MIVMFYKDEGERIESKTYRSVSLLVWVETFVEVLMGRVSRMANGLIDG